MGKRVEKKLCCSKKIVIASYVVTSVITACCIVGFFVSLNSAFPLDITPLVTLAGMAWAETAACNAFYFWKAKHENRIKLTKQMVTDLAKEYGIDAVVSLASIVMSD